MMRIAIITVVVAGFCQAQTQFEVASVKPSRTPPTHRAHTMNDNAIDPSAIPFRIPLQLAYRMEPYQISGTDWLATARFDVPASLPSATTKAQIREMLQILLVDWIAPVVHREPKLQQIHAVPIGKEGPVDHAGKGPREN